MLFWKIERITPAQIIISGFALLILAGTGLLLLPFSTSGAGGASLSDALFTATSATCVTGLVIFDTALYWSPFGQLVILLLIQAGGLGVVTMAVAISMYAGKKIGLKQRCVMQEAISAPQVGGIVRMTGFVIKTTFILEGIGAVLFALRFCPQMGLWRGLWYAVFHSVSSFCNAGFDLMGVQAPFSSFTGFVGDPLVNTISMALIILGGIGFLTWADIREHKWHFRVYKLQTKIIITTTIVLLAVPAIILYFYEFSLANWRDLSFGERVLAAMFQSVTPRTAGFNTVDLTKMSQPTHLLIILLMLTGGAPGSTAGGFKVTTLSVLLLNIRAVFRRRESAQCFGRRIAPEVLRSAVAIFLLYILLFLAGGMLICGIEGVPILSALFEAASAIGTVGLSLGITADLSLPSKLILVFLMYFGRVGGLTMIYAVLSGTSVVPAQLPQEKVTVG